MQTIFHVTILGEDLKLKALDVSALATSVARIEYDVEKIFEPFDVEPQAILCFPAKDKLPSTEIAQSLRMNYPDTSIFFVTYNKSDFNKKLLLKNGFTDAFLLPWEEHELGDALRMALTYAQLPDMKNYVPVSVLDLKENVKINCSTKVHLPMNNKLVHFSAAEEDISPEKLDKLLASNIKTVLIHKDDEAKFSTSFGKKASGAPVVMSETEKRNRLYSVARDLIAEMLLEDNSENTFEKSRDLMTSARDIVKLMVTTKDQPLSSAFTNLKGAPFSFYQHLINVASYAGLFAKALKLENPEHVALAGLLHDIGKMKQSPEADDQLAEHFQHPQYTIDLIKNKRMVVPEITMKAILQHHEAVNGQGFPKKISGPRLCVEARVLAIADELDHCCSMKQKKAGMEPLDALNHLLAANSNEPEKMILDTEIIKQLISQLAK